AKARSIGDGFAGPWGRESILFSHFSLRRDVRGQIGEVKIGLPRLQQGAINPVKQARLMRRKHVRVKSLQHPSERWVALVILHGMIRPLLPQRGNVLSRQAKDSNILRPYLFNDLNVGSIQGADRDSAVQG